MAASGCNKKNTLFSNEIEVAGKYCFEVLEYLQQIEIVKNDFFSGSQCCYLSVKYGRNVFFNNNYMLLNEI